MHLPWTAKGKVSKTSKCNGHFLYPPHGLESECCFISHGSFCKICLKQLQFLIVFHSQVCGESLCLRARWTAFPLPPNSSLPPQGALRSLLVMNIGTSPWGTDSSSIGKYPSSAVLCCKVWCPWEWLKWWNKTSSLKVLCCLGFGFQRSVLRVPQQPKHCFRGFFLLCQV